MSLQAHHNYGGVFASLVITGLPFTFLLTLSDVSGIDPALEQAAATLGAGAPARFAGLSPTSHARAPHHLLLELCADLRGVPLCGAARLGASTAQWFVRVLVPLLLPGVLAALLLVMVRTIAVFELTFLTAGADSQTLVVALYHAVFASGVRAGQEVDVMAVVYMVTTFVWLLLALRFVNPT